jgi:hypothetical protein
VNNISMTLSGGGQPVYMTSYPRSRLPEPGARREEERPPGTVRSILISNVTAVADGCVFLCGMRERPLEGVVLDNIRIRMVGGRHRQPHYDVYCRYADDLKIRNIRITWETPEKPEWGSAIRCRDVSNLEIDGFNGRQALGSDAPAVSLAGAKHVYIHDCWAAEGAGDFVRLGPGTSGVARMNNNLSRAGNPAIFDPPVGRGELFESGNRPPQR